MGYSRANSSQSAAPRFKFRTWFDRRQGLSVVKFSCRRPGILLRGRWVSNELATFMRAETTNLLREGQVIRGTCEVEKFLGEGAFAEVYRVKHRFLGRQAMKVFKTVGMTRDEAERALGEALILSRIGHPNIIRVFDADIAATTRGDCAYFTMEYVAGGTLEKFWRSHGQAFVPVETTVTILRQVCRGLTVAHGETPPIVHRDIKPQNILVGYDIGGLRVRVSDFGLAKRVNPLTLKLTACGTRPFKAPEVFRDPKADSCRGDVWALGCVLYLLLTDRLPYGGAGGAPETKGERGPRPLVAPSALNGEADAALDAIARRALALAPVDRYADAHEMLTDLEAWRPRKATPSKPELSSEMSKTALGPASAGDEAGARRLIKQALAYSRVPGKLMEAADLMEEALTKAPLLRGQYEYQLSLWRKGVVM